MDIVSVHFQNKKNPEDFSGREYSYYAAIPLNVGDIVMVPTQKGQGKARVVRIGVKADEIGFDIGLMKTIETLADAEDKSETAADVSAPSF